MKPKIQWFNKEQVLNIIIIFLISTQFLNAQDLIFKNNGEVIEGKVTEINDNVVKYKKTNVPEDIVFSIDKTLVSKIKYANGNTENFTYSTSSKTQNNPIEPQDIEDRQFDSIIIKKKNIIGWDAAQFVFISAGLAYERFFGKHSQFSFRIPFSFGFYYVGNENSSQLIVNDNSTQTNNYDNYYTQNDNYYIYQRGKIFGASFEFNYYPTGMGRIKYFVGTYVEWGLFMYRVGRWIPNYNPYGYVNYDYRVSNMRYDGQHIAAGINNGFIFHVNKWFTITPTIGLGLKKDETVIPQDRVLTHVKFNVIFGIKF